MMATTEAQSLLELYSTDLTALAHQGRFAPYTDNDAAVERVFTILMRARHTGKATSTKANPALLDMGGETCWPIVAEVVRRMAIGTAPEALCACRVIALDYEALMAGVALAPIHDGLRKIRDTTEAFISMRDPDWAARLSRSLQKHAAWEQANEAYQRLKKIYAALQAMHGQTLFYARHLHRLMGGEFTIYPFNSVSLLKPFLARRQFQIIGTCTLHEYRQYIERDALMQRCFQEICLW